MTPLNVIQYLPFPEIVEPTRGKIPYRIIDSLSVHGLPSTGLVSKKSRIMAVPLAPSGASTIRHELGHVKWSPTKLPKVSYDASVLLAVEDARINLALQGLGLPVDLPDESQRRVMILANEDLGRKDIAAFTLRAIASIGTSALPAVLEALRYGPDEASNVARRLLAMVEQRLETARLRTRHGEIAAFAIAKAIADQIARELTATGLLVKTRMSALAAAIEGCCLSHQPPATGPMARLLTRASEGGGLEDLNPAEMLICAPKLPVACQKTRSGTMAVKAVRTGALVHRPNRWFSDKAIFRGRRMAPGGTVLADTSASMKIDAAGVDRILRAALGATQIAIYSGKDTKGELRIVARNGRRVADKDLTPYGQGNLIDLPALKWLAEQPAPRLWLSDGRVTGVHDWASSIIARQCHAVCKRHAIRRVESAEEAAAVLAGRAAKVRPIIP